MGAENKSLVTNSAESVHPLSILPRRRYFDLSLTGILYAMGGGTLGVALGTLIMVKRFNGREKFPRREFIKYAGGLGAGGVVGGYISGQSI